MAKRNARKNFLAVSAKQCNNFNKLEVPKANSIRRDLNYIVDLQKWKPTDKCSKMVDTFTQVSEVTKKLNFCPSRVIYNNLISLNVNDLSLTPKKNKNLPQKKSTQKDEHSGSNLEDYLEPLEPFVNVVFEPDITVHCYERKFDFISCYYRFIK
uniref:Protein phosphatase 1 regulatory subunit 35 C-terminal domain-containing protein n=1 Tax=Glossina brevipalpis TaxID=37001 RepID=A0A1A9WEY6_9MUSC